MATRTTKQPTRQSVVAFGFPRGAGCQQTVPERHSPGKGEQNGALAFTAERESLVVSASGRRGCYDVERAPGLPRGAQDVERARSCVAPAGRARSAVHDDGQVVARVETERGCPAAARQGNRRIAIWREHDTKESIFANFEYQDQGR